MACSAYRLSFETPREDTALQEKVKGSIGRHETHVLMTTSTWRSFVREPVCWVFDQEHSHHPSQRDESAGCRC